MDSNADLGTSVVSLLNKTPTIIDKIKSIFKKNKEESQKEAEPEELDLSDVTEEPEEKSE